MPAKYHIHTHPTPPRHKPVGKYGIVDWREDCSACHNCVKRECAYGVHDEERDRLHATPDYVDYLYACRGCLCCVQSCTKGLLTWAVNPEYEALGNEVWTPDIISSTWYQAETGSIPVSGAGYPGPFRGPGFDSILTDMSEIVRPTRDGIHGREYISTAVDIGRKPLRLEFRNDRPANPLLDARGSGNRFAGPSSGPAGPSLVTECPPLVEIPLPVFFNMMPWHMPSLPISEAILEAAAKLGTYSITNEPGLMNDPSAVPHMPEQASDSPARTARMAQWSDSPDVVDRIRAAKKDNPDLIAIVRLRLGPDCAERVLQLTDAGIDAVHVCANWKGYVTEEASEGPPRHLSMAIREVHLALVERGVRDAITLIASGGISMAEHVIKSLLCGADAVAIDVPLMIALECRVCNKCNQGVACPLDIDKVERGYAVRRIMNLMGAWHSQFLEMMGAMGIRDARRLRGEVGRAMFFDDLERDCFEPIFGRKVA